MYFIRFDYLQQSMRVCLATLAIGDRYLEEYNRLFRSSQETYAAKNGYDFKVITSYLDSAVQIPDTISLQKLLLCSQDWSADYDFIVYVDADILINPRSPPIHEAIDFGDKIGMVDEYSQPTLERRIQVQKNYGWEQSAREYFQLCGYDLDTNKIFNGGLMVFQPRKHRQFLEDIYSRHVKKNIGHPRGFHFEQTVINYELQVADMLATLPNAFNAVWVIWNSDSPYMSLAEFYKANYFIHMAARHDWDSIKTVGEPSVAGFYQCYKQKIAFEHAIRSFRTVYPSSTLHVFNDGGDDTHEEIARDVSARYTYCPKSVDGVVGLLFSSPQTAMLWFERLQVAMTSSSEDFILLIEDDVWVKKPTPIGALQYDICGINPAAEEYCLSKVRHLIYKENPSLEGKPLPLGGFGGCMLRRSFFKRMFSDMKLVRNYVDAYYQTDSPKYSDCILSFLTYIYGGTTGPYDGLCETWWTTYNDRVNANSIEVLHKYRTLYV
jgi:hypothetical protein